MVQQSIQRLKDEGGEVLYGGERLEGAQYPGGCYMTPCLANAKPDFEIVCHETFGPLLYLMTYRDFDEAIAINNGVPAGPDLRDFHERRARSGEIPERGRQRLRHRQREHRHERRGDRRRVRRRERRPAAAARAEAIRGRCICAGRRTRSIIRPSCRLAQGIQFGGDDAGSATA